MFVHCPKCQETVKFEAAQIEDGVDIVCESCLSLLKMQIVPEVVSLPEASLVLEDLEDINERPEEREAEMEQSADFFDFDDKNASNDNELEDKDEVILRASEDHDPIEDPMDADVEGEMENTNFGEVDRAGKNENGDKEDILLCVDGEATRELVGDLLKDTHFRLIHIPSEMDALMSAKIQPPKLALIDADLMAEKDANLCAALRKHPALKNTRFILVGSMFEKNTKYRKEAPPMKGADDYIGRYYIQNDLLEKIKNLIEREEGPLEDGIDRYPAVDGLSDQDISIDAQDESFDTEGDAKALEEAQRLARIVVSDIFIYNEDKVDQGIRDNNFYDLLEEEIEEGRRLFESRIPEALRVTSNCYEKALEDAIDKRKAARAQDIQSPPAVPENSLENDSNDSALDFSDVMNSAEETAVHASAAAEQAPEALAEAEDSEAVKNAKRLARIIVSDIVIYNEKKVEEGLQSDRFYELLEEEVQEGRQLYASRIDKSLLNGTDYLQEAFDDYINKKKASAPIK